MFLFKWSLYKLEKVTEDRVLGKSSRNKHVENRWKRWRGGWRSSVSPALTWADWQFKLPAITHAFSAAPLLSCTHQDGYQEMGMQWGAKKGRACGLEGPKWVGDTNITEVITGVNAGFRWSEVSQETRAQKQRTQKGHLTNQRGPGMCPCLHAEASVATHGAGSYWPHKRELLEIS